MRMSRGKLGIESHRLLKLGLGLTLAALFKQRGPQVVVGLGRIRPQPHGLLAIVQSLVEIAL